MPLTSFHCGSQRTCSLTMWVEWVRALSDIGVVTCDTRRSSRGLGNGTDEKRPCGLHFQPCQGSLGRGLLFSRYHASHQVLGMRQGAFKAEDSVSQNSEPVPHRPRSSGLATGHSLCVSGMSQGEVCPQPPSHTSPCLPSALSHAPPAGQRELTPYPLCVTLCWTQAPIRALIPQHVQRPLPPVSGTQTQPSTRA